jgi:KDO2-lipid IV(A) lauroyltransferase
MIKPPRKLKLMVEYVGLKFLVLVIKVMPWSLAIKSGEVLGSLLPAFLPRRYKRTKSDIERAFPRKSPQEIEKITKESWVNIGRMSSEFVKCSQMSKAELTQRVEFRNFEPLLEHNRQGKGGILHIGHFVNWEVIGLAAGYAFDKMSFVARPQSNPYVDKQLTRMRTASGSKMISSYNPFFSTFKMIKKGYMVGILSDQSAKTEATFYMNFMGRPAEVAPMTAVVALKLGTPIYPVKVRRENGKIIIEAQQPIYAPHMKYSTKTSFDLTRTLMKKYEEWIKEDPASWLWAHNRWRREKHSLDKMGKQEKRLNEA